MSSSKAPLTAKEISAELNRQYKSSDFKFPTSYDKEEAVRFKAIRERMFVKRAKLRSPTGSSSTDLDDVHKDDGELLEAALPNAIDREKFWLWVHDQYRIIRTTYIAGTAEDYIKAFSETDFADRHSVGKLYQLRRALASPCILIGSWLDCRYRVNPNLRILGPDEDLIDWEDPREDAEEPIIGINLAGQRIKYQDAEYERWLIQRGDRSHESCWSGFSDESTLINGVTRFVCCEVGTVQVTDQKRGSDKDKQSDRQHTRGESWRDADWVMVVVIEEHGMAGAVWLLQNFNPTIEHTSDQYTIVPGNPNDLYGWYYFEGERDLDQVPMQRGGVKIANKITDLSETCEWTMDEHIPSTYEIRQAVLATRTQRKSPVIVRQLSKAGVGDDSSPDVSMLRIRDEDY
ncbi:hypothetical protein ACET3X_008618 [Alternaria dauci]|uniref:Uncharacterized protein n=1 Tax=Alternaria dauci TaxID=48095 RepID=A0ABR3UAW7_9PLEO